jgi:hypothetical protein
MPAVTVPKDSIVLGAGYLFKAPLGSSAPTNTVAGSIFTDAWPVAWIPIGVTKQGHSWSYKLSTDTLVVAEYLPPLKIVETGVDIGVDFEIVQVTVQNYKLSMNGGTVTTVSGTGATTLTKYGPPAVGGSVRTMLGWESEDGTERVIWYQCLQNGELKVQHQKGADSASLPVSFGVEQPSSGDSFNIWTAGTVRVGT